MLRFVYLFFTSALALAINPPWQNLDSLLKNTIGADPCVSVGDFQSSTNTIDVQACSSEVATGLALVVKSQYNYGRTVTVRILGPDGQVVTPPAAPADSSDVLALVQTSVDNALATNPLYAGTAKGNQTAGLFVELKRRIVQYWSDDIGDAFGNVNMTSEQAFQQVLNTTYFGTFRLGVTTAPRTTPH